MDIGLKIKRLRLNMNISQANLAVELGIAQNTLGLIESGETKKIDFMLMCKVCKIFNVDFNHFIDEIKFKQINKQNSTDYMSKSKNIQVSKKDIEQYELRLKEKDEFILLQKDIIEKLSSLLNDKIK